MFTRRDILTIGTATATAAIAGCSSSSSNNPAIPTEECASVEDEEGDEEANWRQPVSLIKSIQTPADSRIQKIEFYENGAVKIYPDDQPECYDTMILKHKSTSISTETGISDEFSEGLATWFFQSDNVLTADMAGSIQGKCNYPNTMFEIREISSDGSCSNPNSVIKFDVPDTYMPDTNP